MSDYLTAEQIAQFSDPDQFVFDMPVGTLSSCAYCGSKTSSRSYKDTKSGDHYPSCCAKECCIDKWEPDVRGGRS